MLRRSVRPRGSRPASRALPRRSPRGKLGRNAVRVDGDQADRLGLVHRAQAFDDARARCRRRACRRWVRQAPVRRSRRRRGRDRRRMNSVRLLRSIGAMRARAGSSREHAENAVRARAQPLDDRALVARRAVLAARDSRQHPFAAAERRDGLLASREDQDRGRGPRPASIRPGGPAARRRGPRRRFRAPSLRGARRPGRSCVLRPRSIAPRLRQLRENPLKRLSVMAFYTERAAQDRAWCRPDARPDGRGPPPS